VIGLFAGLGLAKALNSLLNSLGIDLPHAGTVFKARTVIVSLLVGILVTVLAARIVTPTSAPGEHALGLDFLSFYTAASALNEGRVADLYDLKATQRYQASIGERDGVALEGRYAPWWNPPFYAELFRPLAHFRFQTAYAIWTAINLVALALSSMLLMRLLPEHTNATHAWLIPCLMLISVPMFLTITHGQNACSSLLVLTVIVSLWRSNRAFAAGICGALLFYKPQLAVVIAVVMTIDLGWRALAGYLVAGSSLLVANVVALPGTLTVFLRTVPLNLAYVQNQCLYPWDRHATSKAFWRVLLQGEGIAPTSGVVNALGIACIAVVGAMIVVSISAHNGGARTRRDRLIAATIAATPLLMPFYFDYDLLLLAVPAVLVAAEWIGAEEHGLSDRWLLGTFIALYLSLLIAPDLAERLRFNPVPPLLAMVVFPLIHRIGWPQRHSTSRRAQSDNSCRMPACS